MPGEKKRPLNENLSRNLRMIYALRRGQQGGNLAEFSSELGIGHTTLQNILSQKCNLTLDTVELIAEKLNLSPLQLLADQYPETDLTRGVLLLRVIGMYSGLPPERRGRVAMLLCRLLEELAEGETAGFSG